MPVRVSVILPTFNEVGNIVELITAIKRHVLSPWECEIVVVDDNSCDGTLERVRHVFAADPEVLTILRTSDRGLAASIRAGLEVATGDYFLVMDTDFTHRPEEIPAMLHVVHVTDLVSGSRFCPGGNMAHRGHYMASFVYNLMVRILIHTQIQDNLGGFWIARADLIRRLPFDKIFFGYGDYYFRLLHFAQHAGMKVIELPAEYRERNSGTSKSSFGKLFLQYSAMVFQLMLDKRPGKRMRSSGNSIQPVRSIHQRA